MYLRTFLHTCNYVGVRILAFTYVLARCHGLGYLHAYYPIQCKVLLWYRMKVKLHFTRTVLRGVYERFK